jgi:WD40 repeat protein
VASGGADSNLRMWRVASSVPVGGGQENEGDVWAVDWSPRGSLVASGGADTTVRVWNDRGLPLKRLNGHTEAVRVVAFSPDGALLASAGLDGSVRVWGLR